MTTTTLPESIASYMDQIAALCQKHGARRLDLFGSAARGDFDPVRSDFDFVVDFGDTVMKPWMGNYFDLKEDLEALLGRPVDLIMEGARRNRYFERALKQERKAVYAA